MPSPINTTTMGTAYSSGRRMTASANRRQKTESADGGVFLRMMASESMRVPSIASIAGSTMIALNADRTTVALAAMPTDRRK
jgi:hypothetical protein